MRKFFILMAQLLVTIARLMKPGGAKAVMAENLLLKQQLLVACRTRHRTPRLSALGRLGLGFWSLFLTARRRARAAILLKPSTLLRFHAALVQRKLTTYQCVRRLLPSRRTFFEHLRALMQYILFESWEHMLSSLLGARSVHVRSTSLVGLSINRPNSLALAAVLGENAANFASPAPPRA